MKKTTLIVLALCLVALVGLVSFMSASPNNSDSWTQKFQNTQLNSVINVPVGDAHFLSYQGKYYAIMYGGVTYYDPNTDEWTVTNHTSGVELWYPGISVCQDSIYALGGYAFKVYDPVSQSWQLKASPPAPILDSSELYSMDDKIYAYGYEHVTNSSFPQVTWIYDPANDSWSESASHMPQFSYHSGVVIDNKLYVVGTNGQTTSLWIFDPETGNWSQGTPLPNAMSGLSACATSGVYAPKRLYVVGGASGGQQIEIYDPQTNAWNTDASPPSNFTVSSITSVDDQLYAFGYCNFPVDNILQYQEIYVYTPQNYQVSPTSTYVPSSPLSQNPTNGPTVIPTIEPTATIAASPSQPSDGFGSPNSTSIPEFQAWLILPIGAAIIAVSVAYLTKKQRR